MTTLADYSDEQRREWGRYVATERIFIGGALAFLPGDPVPIGHVEGDDAPVSKEQVARVNTKAAEAATKEG